MKSRTRSPSTTTTHRFLRPGALARLRDARIRPRSVDLAAILPIPSSPAAAAAQDAGPFEAQVVDVDVDVSKCLEVRCFGPRFPQRRRLLASKAVVMAMAASEGADLLLAH